MKKVKIAYVLPYLGVSGGVSVVLQHTNRLLKRGHDVTIGSQAPVAPIDWFPNQSVPVVALDDLPDDLDILVATGWQTSFVVAGLKARHKCYFVQSDETRFHDSGSDNFHITQLSYSMNFHFLTEAKWIKRWLLENFGKDAELIPNGLDKDLFFPDTPLREKTRKKRVLLEGAIDLPFKGMYEAFEAVKDLDVEVWCVSSYGRPKAGWKCDEFFEQIPMTGMRNIYSSCDILLKMSRVEGFFGPPLEMMACGGVCVVGKVTGYDEYIVDEENAMVVGPSDVKGATEAIRRLIDDAKLAAKLRKNGLKTAEEWDWESSVDKLEKYFVEIAGEKYGRFSLTQEQTNQSVRHFSKRVSVEHPPVLCSQLFIDTGLGFEEGRSLLRRMDDKGVRLIEFDLCGFGGIKRLRFDPINDCATVRIGEINVYTKDGGRARITHYVHNGVEKDGYLLFATDDPQIYINLEDMRKPEKLTVSLDFIAIGPEVLKERNIDLEKEVHCLKEELAGIYESRGWKFLLKCNRIKDRFSPSRSKR